MLALIVAVNSMMNGSAMRVSSSARRLAAGMPKKMTMISVAK